MTSEILCNTRLTLWFNWGHTASSVKQKLCCYSSIPH